MIHGIAVAAVKGKAGLSPDRKATPMSSPDGPFDTPVTAAKALKAVEKTGFLK
jgi:hypothetical protein